MSALLRLCAAIAVLCVIAASATPASALQCHSATDCRAPVPQLCKVCGNGQEACAHFACVAGQCQIQYCPVGGAQCHRAADCSGPLPQLCRLCPNGREQCVHHTCASGKCGVAICPGHG
ncbi:MAG TPA: hypothetical protein VGI95_12780 [Caulobacteraceae bacterium]|jgi:hypothetical protein